MGREENLIALRADLEANTGYYLFRVARVPDYTLHLVELGLQLGDLIQNLRAALDHMTFQFALYNTKSDVEHEERAMFPIATCPNRFKGAKGRWLQEVHEEHSNFIESLQPSRPWNERRYTAIGTQHPLAALQSLSNRDKHRVINPVTTLSNFIFLRDGIEYGYGVTTVGFREMQSIIPLPFPSLVADLQVGTPVQRALLHRALASIDVAGYLQPTVLLPDGGGVLNASLDAFKAFIGGVLEEAEALPLPLLTEH